MAGEWKEWFRPESSSQRDWLKRASSKTYWRSTQGAQYGLIKECTFNHVDIDINVDVDIDIWLS